MFFQQLLNTEAISEILCTVQKCCAIRWVAVLSSKEDVLQSPPMIRNLCVTNEMEKVFRYISFIQLYLLELLTCTISRFMIYNPYLDLWYIKSESNLESEGSQVKWRIWTYRAYFDQTQLADAELVSTVYAFVSCID